MNNSFLPFHFKFFFAVILFSLFTFENSESQITFQATVANQIVNGSTISFDIYLTRTGANDLYLGNADLVFTFNNVNFTNPEFEFVDGSSVLKNSNGTPTTSYEAVFAPAILAPGNILVININQPVFSNQTQFNSRIAKIDDTPNTHKLGTFTVSGITNNLETFDLQWKTLPPGISSNVQTLTNTDPWISSAATGEYQNPPNQTLPVELLAFTATTNKNTVHLFWSTAKEINNSGFEIERKHIDDQEWVNAGFKVGAGTIEEVRDYSFSERLNTGKYQFRLKQIDYNGNYEYFTLALEIEIGVPDKFSLSQNYPNPFNPTTKIDFDLPIDTKVSLIIYDITGREVKVLLKNEIKTAGYYTAEFNGINLSSGVYFYRLTTSKDVATKKMVVLK